MERLKYRILAYFVLCLKKDEHLKIDDVAGGRCLLPRDTHTGNAILLQYATILSPH